MTTVETYKVSEKEELNVRMNKREVKQRDVFVDGSVSENKRV